jgi:hypothetical protein
MNARLVRAAMLVCAVLWMSARAGEAELEQLIVIDEQPEAFFEYAPRALEYRMRRALGKACKSLATPAPFCGVKEVKFLRSVTVYGNKQVYGFACDDRLLYALNKYFTPEDIRGRTTCVYIDCNYSDHHCEADRDGLVKAEVAPGDES